MTLLYALVDYANRRRVKAKAKHQVVKPLETGDSTRRGIFHDGSDSARAPGSRERSGPARCHRCGPVVARQTSGAVPDGGGTACGAARLVASSRLGPPVCIRPAARGRGWL